MQGAGGYIKSYRSILDWEWFKDRNTLQMWIYILHRVNYEPSRFMGMTIERGQMLESYRKMAENTGLTVDQVRTAIKHLTITGEITRQITRHGMLISVVKFSTYQGSDDL